MLAFLQNEMNTGNSPYEIMEEVIGPAMTANIKNKYTQGGLNPYNPEDVDIRPWKLLFEIMTEPAPRDRLETVTSIDHVVKLLKTSKNILIVTGAGVSVSCGIPDFRSRDGVYAKLSVDYPDLPDPSAMFDIDFFIQNPMPFFDFAGQLWPGNYTPSSTHKFIARLDQNNQLLRNFTQNIDTLEQVAGIKNVVQCHGSFAMATCMKCKKKYDADDIKERVMKKEIPYCDCSDERFTPFVYLSNLGENPTIEEIEVDSEQRYQEKIKWKNQVLPIIKPDIVFFGESLSDDFHKQIELDKDKADLLIVIGSSMKVRPVSLIPTAVDESVPQILINRERLKGDLKFDVELLGDGDDIINELVNRLDNGCENAKITETESIEEVGVDKYFTVGMKNCENKSYIFRGAEHVFEDRSRVAGEEQSTESDKEDKSDETEVETRAEGESVENGVVENGIAENGIVENGIAENGVTEKSSEQKS